MNTLSQLAGKICFACIAASMVRLIFPGSNLKAVINTVMVLYILSAALEWPDGEKPPLKLTSVTTASAVPATDALTHMGEAWYLQELARELGCAAELEGKITITEDGICIADVPVQSRSKAESALLAAGWQGEISFREPDL